MNRKGIVELGILVLQRLKDSDELSLRVVLLRRVNDSSALMLILLVFRGFVVEAMFFSYYFNRYQVLRLRMSYSRYIVLAVIYETESWVQCGSHALVPQSVGYITFSYYQTTTSTYQEGCS